MNTVTATRALIETKLDRDLATYVSERRQAGDSWRAIAEDVSAAAGVTVSYETLRTWFGGAA